MWCLCLQIFILAIWMIVITVLWWFGTGYMNTKRCLTMPVDCAMPRPVPRTMVSLSFSFVYKNEKKVKSTDLSTEFKGMTFPQSPSVGFPARHSQIPLAKPICSQNLNLGNRANDCHVGNFFHRGFHSTHGSMSRHKLCPMGIVAIQL